MALGSFDEWGLWQPGEDDSYATVSAQYRKMMASVKAALRNGAVPIVANQAARDLLVPAPVKGNRVYRSDIDSVQRYSGVQWVLWEGAVPFTVAAGFTLTAGAIVRTGRAVTVNALVAATAAYTALAPILSITDAANRPITNARISARNGTSASNGLAYVGTDGAISTQIAIANGNTFDFAGSWVAP